MLGRPIRYTSVTLRTSNHLRVIAGECCSVRLVTTCVPTAVNCGKYCWYCLLCMVEFPRLIPASGAIRSNMIICPYIGLEHDLLELLRYEICCIFCSAAIVSVQIRLISVTYFWRGVEVGGRGNFIPGIRPRPFGGFRFRNSCLFVNIRVKVFSLRILPFSNLQCFLCFSVRNGRWGYL